MKRCTCGRSTRRISKRSGLCSAPHVTEKKEGFWRRSTSAIHHELDFVPEDTIALTGLVQQPRLEIVTGIFSVRFRIYMHDESLAVELDFGENELTPAVAQDASTDEILMLAYVSPEALAKTQNTGLAHYYSRSREELWQKGQSSGNIQRVDEIRVDCDGDALLYRVEQEGGACHTGYRSCFYRTIDGSTTGEKLFDPDEVYE